MRILAAALLTSLASQAALAIHSGPFLGVGLNSQQQTINFNSESVTFRGWGLNAEAGLGMELSKSVGASISLGLDYSELLNKARDNSFIEQGVQTRKELKAALHWNSASFGLGTSQDELRARIVDVSSGSSESIYNGNSQFGFFSVNFDHSKTVQTIIEARYYKGQLEEHESTGYSLGLKILGFF